MPGGMTDRRRPGRHPGVGGTDIPPMRVDLVYHASSRTTMVWCQNLKKLTIAGRRGYDNAARGQSENRRQAKASEDGLDG